MGKYVVCLVRLQSIAVLSIAFRSQMAHAIHLAWRHLALVRVMVIIPTFTMIATANVIKYLGATPVFVDARSGHGILTSKIEEVILQKKSYYCCAYLWASCEMDTIMEIAKKHNLWVIEGSRSTWSNVSWASLERLVTLMFSMYAKK